MHDTRSALFVLFKNVAQLSVALFLIPSFIGLLLQGEGSCGINVPLPAGECPLEGNLANCLDVACGELCEGDGECGTVELDNCGDTGYDIYRKTCATPKAPPAPIAPTYAPTNAVTNAPTNAPTYTPTGAPPTSTSPPTKARCLDSILDVAETNGKGCSFIAENQEFCGNGVFGLVPTSHCPLSCNSCDEFGCVDSTASFKVGGGTYTCDDLASLSDSDVETYCNIEAAYSTCRGTCNTCDL